MCTPACVCLFGGRVCVCERARRLGERCTGGGGVRVCACVRVCVCVRVCACA